MSDGIDFEAEALKRCRGRYQRCLIHGTESWSGSSLKGKAKEYGRHYAKSRRRLLDRLILDGVAHLVVTEHNKIELHFGPPGRFYIPTRCAAGPAWKVPKPEELPALIQLAMAGDESAQNV